MKLFAFLRKRHEPSVAVQAFARHWTRQFRLYTRGELKAGADAVADAYQADLNDRTLAAKFMIITTALKHCSRSSKPPAIKRYFFLPGDTKNCTRNFLAAPLDLPASMSDGELLRLLKHPHSPHRSRKARHHHVENLTGDEPTRLAHFVD